MTASSSIAQEYYKVVDLWAGIDSRTEWKLAIWSVAYNDIDLIDDFLEIERSPVGQFDDIFFRFDAEYEGDNIAYAQSLWEEYASWFQEEPNPEYDMIAALRQDDMLVTEYVPDVSIERNFSNLWKEMLRFKSSIKRLDDINFCIYLPPPRSEGVMKTGLFGDILDEGVPEGVRLVTVDYAQNRRIKIGPSAKVAVLKPKLNMQPALRNALERDGDSNDLLAPESRFKQQVTAVMNCTLEKDKKKMDREVRTLLSIAEEMNDPSISISSLLISSEAYYAIREYGISMKYSDQTIEQAARAMEAELPAGFDYWKMAMFMKAAILSVEKKRNEAVRLYDSVAQEALKRQDAFSMMEGYRMSGFMYYEMGKTEKAFETFLLSLAGGRYLSLDMRRTSTFVISANLALLTGRKVRSPDDITLLENQLAEWLGDDWRQVVEGENMKQAKTRRKSSFFS